ncbi:hypothetical protein L195_g014547 [Trifolium pratense]|uniref:Sulfate transporter n=1 Tax=Trifolium pratense TaxID=57577 RepID=A0A2K3PR85_TRIPR|nr:hypothetical protein L195_g014547 [Trifolium pratense]
MTEKSMTDIDKSAIAILDRLSNLDVIFLMTDITAPATTIAIVLVLEGADHVTSESVARFIDQDLGIVRDPHLFIINLVHDVFLSMNGGGNLTWMGDGDRKRVGDRRRRDDSHRDSRRMDYDRRDEGVNYGGGAKLHAINNGGVQLGDGSGGNKQEVHDKGAILCGRENKQHEREGEILGSDLKRVAMFERNVSGARRNPERLRDGLGQGDDMQLSKEGKQDSEEQECSDLPEGVQVGEIVIKLGARKEDLVKKPDSTKVVAKTSNMVEQLADPIKERKVFLRSYQTTPDDIQWALNGVVATIVNGEAIPVVQNRIMDAGFNDLVLVPMGADKVFVRSTENVDSNSIINNAKEFFKLVFSSWMRWKMRHHLTGEVLGFVFDKNRLDFARVLIATPELDIIKRSVTVLVDGLQVEIKIVEEWSYAMGEDSCLFEEESESEVSQADCGEGQVDPEVNRNVDMFINQFKEGMEEEDHIEPQGMRVEEPLDKFDANPGLKGVGTPSVLRMGSKEALGDQVGQVEVSSPSVDSQVRPSIQPFISKRTNSCPLEARRSVISGPWSLEWLQDQNHRDAGVIFSASRKSKKVSQQGPRFKKQGEHDLRRRKAGGLLRHPVHSLK